MILQLIKRFVKRVVSLVYLGNKLECPCCNLSFRRMKPYEARFFMKGGLVDCYTENAICPNCGSDIRHRFTVAFLRNNSGLLHENIKLLYFAPEEGVFRFLKKQRNISCVNCDIEPDNYSKYGAVRVDITDIQFADDSFDAVIAIHVLEHIENDAAAIKQLYRVIKPGGWALIAVPISGEITYEDKSLDSRGRMNAYGIAEHFRINGLDFKNKLSENGFHVETYTVENIPGNYIDRQARSAHVESDKYLFLCRK